MTTYGVMQDRIIDECARDTDSAFPAIVRREIQSAIRHYERERFFFNEKRATFSVSSSQEWYTSADLSDLPGIVEFDGLTINLNSRLCPLTQRTFAYLEAIMSATTIFGDPTEFCIYRQQIRVYPVPNQGRAVTASYLYKFTTLSASTDTNAWMTDGEELIRSRAKRKLYAEVIKDTDQAVIAAQSEAEALGSLRTETTARLASGRIMPRYF